MAPQVYRESRLFKNLQVSGSLDRITIGATPIWARDEDEERRHGETSVVTNRCSAAY